MSEIQRIINFRPAGNKRFKEPEPTKNYGIHGVEIYFIVRNEDYALRFVVNTNWYLPADEKKFWHKPLEGFLARSFGLSFHVKINREISQKEFEYTTDNCDIFNASCMSDISYRDGDEFFLLLKQKSSDKLFAQLEKRFLLDVKDYEENENANSTSSTNSSS